MKKTRKMKINEAVRILEARGIRGFGDVERAVAPAAVEPKIRALRMPRKSPLPEREKIVTEKREKIVTDRAPVPERPREEPYIFARMIDTVSGL